MVIHFYQCNYETCHVTTTRGLRQQQIQLRLLASFFQFYAPLDAFKQAVTNALGKL